MKNLPKTISDLASLYATVADHLDTRIFDDNADTETLASAMAAVLTAATIAGEVREEHDKLTRFSGRVLGGAYCMGYERGLAQACTLRNFLRATWINLTKRG
jgi:hypothetical protein